MKKLSLDPPPIHSTPLPIPHHHPLHLNMAERHHLLRPLLPQSTTSPPPLDVPNNLNLISSNSGLTLRLLLLALIGTISIWANHEASKGYSITIINESTNTFAGKRFQLFYVSNDEATRMVIRASNTVENLLYRDSSSSTKKPVRSVIVKLAGHNLTDHVLVESGSGHDEFVLNISPSILGGTNFKRDMTLAIRKGVARFWLWDGQGKAPKSLIDGIVDYLVNNLDSSLILLPTDVPTSICWNFNDRKIVAEFLTRRPGLVGKLNEAMKDGWSDEKFGVLGVPVHKVCGNSESLRYNSSSV